MNEYADRDPLAELAALRQRLEQLEQLCEQQRQVSPRLLFPRKFVLSALVGTLLMASVAVLWGAEAIAAIFVDPNGNVGIGTNQPGAKLDVSGGAAFSNVGINHVPYANQNLIVVPNQDTAFNVTDPSNTIHWLTVGKEGAVSMNGASVNIGTEVEDPAKSTTLNVKGTANFNDAKMANAEITGNVNVKGEIRGKLWISQEYHNPGPMTKADRSVCFITTVRLGLKASNHALTAGGITKDKDGFWNLSPGEYDYVAARCIGAPE